VKRLSGLDASFLYLETPSMHMHVSGFGVFDPTTAKREITYERVLETIQERMHLAPLFRERLAFVPLELHHPVWVHDPDFDVEYHVRRAALPSPGSDREMAAFAADVASKPLDRSRPLWEMYLVEGLADGNLAVISKTHHAAVDGVSGTDLAVATMDLEPDPPPVEPPARPFTPERVPPDLELLLYALGSLARHPFRIARALPQTVRAIGNVARGRAAREPNLRPPPAPFQAPRTSLNVSITPHRKFSFSTLPLDDVKRVKNRLGGTVNDVVLALCSGALRRYFERRGERVDGDLVASVPISVRADEQKGEQGNQVSSMLCSLANTVNDPVERLHAISDGTKGAKERHHAIGANMIPELAEFVPGALASRAARLYSRMKLADRHRPIFNLTISNVPGPPFPLYSYGARMVASYPMGPINEGAALNITVTSYMNEHMFFGFHACREAVGDVWEIAGGVEDALEELLKAAA
jgi:diacylglycerol O-acyltransferase / wax synthase